MPGGRLLVIAVAAALLPAIACGGGSKQSTPQAGGQPTATPRAQASPAATQPGATGQATATPRAQASPAATQPSGAQPADELRNIGAAMGTIRSFRVKMTLEATGQGRQEGTVEIVAPDRYRIKMGGVEMIAIGNDAYLSFAPNQWIKQPGGAGGLPFNPQDLTNSVRDFATLGLTRGATDTVEGKSCRKYSASAPTTGSIEYCIGADNFPVRIVSEAAGTKITLIFTDINVNIDIRAPI